MCVHVTLCVYVLGYFLGLFFVEGLYVFVFMNICACVWVGVSASVCECAFELVCMNV